MLVENLTYVYSIEAIAAHHRNYVTQCLKLRENKASNFISRLEAILTTLL